MPEATAECLLSEIRSIGCRGLRGNQCGAAGGLVAVARSRTAIDDASRIAGRDDRIPVVPLRTSDPVAHPGNADALNVGTWSALDNDSTMVGFVAN